MKYQKGFSPLLAILIISALVVACIVGFFLILQYLNSPQGERPGQDTMQGNQLIDTTAWDTLEQSQVGFRMKYPKDFFEVNHQPKLFASSCSTTNFPQQCPDITSVISADQDARSMYDTISSVSQITINNTPYCLAQSHDAATGHTYNFYYYITVKNIPNTSSQTCLVVYFATSQTNCDFYLPLQEGNVEQQKNYQDCVVKNNQQPIILNKIASTFQLER